MCCQAQALTDRPRELCRCASSAIGDRAVQAALSRCPLRLLYLTCFHDSQSLAVEYDETEQFLCLLDG